jgi:hypothetical protein
MDFETRLNTISERVWQTWTSDGLGLDDDLIYQTRKTAQDAANNTYQDGITDDEWTFYACMNYLSI